MRLSWPAPVRADVREHGFGEILVGLWVLLLEVKRPGDQVLNNAVRLPGAAMGDDYHLTLATVVKRKECGAGYVIERDCLNATTHRPCRPGR